MPQFDVVGVGHVSLDNLGIVETYPQLDQRVRMNDFLRQGGGEVATALVTLARLGAKVSFVGKVGDDESGEFICKEFIQEGVDISQLVKEKGKMSLTAFCIIDQMSGKRTIFWYKNLTPLRLNEIDPDFLCQGKILHLDAHEPETAYEAARYFREHAEGRRIVLDIDNWDKQREKLVALTDVLIGSETFAKNFHPTNPYIALEKVAALGPKVVILTQGERGCLGKAGNENFQVPGYQVDVVDTTGCGDVFHGAFVFGLLKNWDMVYTARFANAVAALKCTKLGGRSGIPNLTQTQEFMEKMK
ncbi:MAG TPA: carbohydrate kinase family protein [Candidatus Atribacteria bacterium]|nr:carbohydrate kinase family protein [Candidatus Atribacteria bacterium]